MRGIPPAFTGTSPSPCPSPKGEGKRLETPPLNNRVRDNEFANLGNVTTPIRPTRAPAPRAGPSISRLSASRPYPLLQLKGETAKRPGGPLT